MDTLDEFIKKATPKVSSNTISNIDDYIMAARPSDDYKQEITPVPSIPVAPRNRVYDAFRPLALSRPQPEELTTNVNKNFIKLLPSELLERTPFGVGEVIKQYRDNPQDFKNVTFEDVLSGLVATSKGVYAGVVGAGLNFIPKQVSFNLPIIGKVSNRQFNTAQRITKGEDMSTVLLEEGTGAILDTLMLVGLAQEIASPRHVTVAKTEFKGATPSGITATAKPKPFRLYTEPVATQAMSPKVVEKLATEQGFNLGNKFDNTLPTYFKLTGTSKGNMKYEVVQIKPSYLNMFFSKFKSNINITPDNMIVPIISRELPVQDILKTKPTITTPQVSEIIPMVENAVATKDEHLIETVKTMAQESGDITLVEKVDNAIALAEESVAQNKVAEDKLDQIIEGATPTPEKDLTEPSYQPYTPARAVPANRVYQYSSSDKFITGEYEGKPFTTDTYILEFNSNVQKPPKAYQTEALPEESVRQIIPKEEDLVKTEIVKVQTTGKNTYVSIEGDGVTATLQQKYYDYFIRHNNFYYKLRKS